MGLSWNRFLLLVFIAGIFICISFAWLLVHEEARIMLVGSGVTPQAGLMIVTASLGVLAFAYPPAWWLMFEVIPFLGHIKREGWKVGRLIYKRERCKHVWVYDPENSAKRTCSKCDCHQSLFQRPYPSVGEPSLNWRNQNFDELRFL